MADTFIDHCIFVLRHLRHIPMHSDDKWDYIYEPPSLTAQYLIDKKLIDVEYLKEPGEPPMRVCLSESGEEELRRLDNRAKRHMALIAILIVCGTACGTFATLYISQFDFIGTKLLFYIFSSTTLLAPVFGFASLIGEIECYLKGYELGHSVSKWKSSVIALGLMILLFAIFSFFMIAASNFNL